MKTYSLTAAYPAVNDSYSFTDDGNCIDEEAEAIAHGSGDDCAD